MNRIALNRLLLLVVTGVFITSIPAHGGERADRPIGDHRIAAWVGKAEAAKRRGDISAALVYRRKAAQAAPQDAALRVGLAYAYLAVGRHGAASAMFHDAIAMRGPSDETRRGLALAQNELRAADSQRRMLASASMPATGSSFTGAEATLASYLK